MRGLDDINAHKFAQSLRDGEGQGSLVCCSTAATATAKSLQSCPTLRDPMDWSLPGSSVHGIFQARVLEWVAIAFSNYTSIKKKKVTCKQQKKNHDLIFPSPISGSALPPAFPA